MLTPLCSSQLGNCTQQHVLVPGAHGGGYRRAADGEAEVGRHLIPLVHHRGQGDQPLVALEDVGEARGDQHCPGNQEAASEGGRDPEKVCSRHTELNLWTVYSRGT